MWEAKPKQQTTFRKNFRRVYLRRIQVRSVTSTHGGIIVDCAFSVAVFGSSVTSLAENRSCSDDDRSPPFRVDLEKRWAVACTSRRIWPRQIDRTIPADFARKVANEAALLIMGATRAPTAIFT